MKIVVLSRSMAFPQKWKIIFLFLSFIYFKQQGMLPSDLFFKKQIIQFFKRGGWHSYPKSRGNSAHSTEVGKKIIARYTLTLSTYKKNHALSEQQSMFPEIFSIVSLIVIALSASKAEWAKNPARLTLVHPIAVLIPEYT